MHAHTVTRTRARPPHAQEEARVEGEALYERLRGFDLTGDGAVGLDDLVALFRWVGLLGRLVGWVGGSVGRSVDFWSYRQ